MMIIDEVIMIVITIHFTFLLDLDLSGQRAASLSLLTRGYEDS